MAFEPLHRLIHRDAFFESSVTDAIANARTRRAHDDALLHTIRQALPETLRTNVASVSTSPRALSIVSTSHAAATKLYQFQQILLTAIAAKGLNLNEIRVIVQTQGLPSRPLRVKPVLPAAAAVALNRAITTSKNDRLRAALTRLQSHASTR